MGMSTAIFASRNIIRIEYPVDGERYVNVLVDIRQVSLRIMIFVQLK
jgi:hypothetical protein